jgi:hypothetical protein
VAAVRFGGTGGPIDGCLDSVFKAVLARGETGLGEKQVRDMQNRTMKKKAARQKAKQGQARAAG